MSIRISLKNIFLTFYYAVLICLLVLPMFKYTVKYVPIILFSVPLIVLYCISCKNGIKNFAVILGALMMMFVFSFLVNSTFLLNQSLNFSIASYLCFLPFFMFDYVVKRNDKQLTKMILVVSVLIFVYVFAVTMRELFVNPFVARQLASGVKDDPYLNALRARNVGGFGFSYAVSMFIPYVAMKIVSTTGKAKRLFTILFIILLIYGFYSQYTTLIIISIVASILIFAIYSKNFIVRVMLVVTGVVLLFGMKYIFKFLAYHLPLEALAQHFQSMYLSIVTGEDTTSRAEYIKICLRMFIKHPFFGVNVVDSYNSYYVNHAHSMYFPLLASKGIFGTSLYIGITYYIIKSVNNILGEYKALLPVFAAYIILGFLNPNNSFEISVAVFMIIPLAEYMFLQKKKERAIYLDIKNQ